MGRKITLTLFILFLLLTLTATPLGAREPKISAEAAILIDADTGEILFSKNHLEPRPPASLTKIMTAILAIELGKLDDVVSISTRAAQTGEASINLVAGEKITLENLLYGALLKSGNDACVAIAEHIAPSVEDFVKLMNFKAQILGCYNTNFVNTNGLPAKNHYTTAYDLSLISRYALQNSIFAQMVSTPTYTLHWEEGGRKRTINNTNRLLNSYQGATGVKTGTTIEAGQCLIASATRENRDLIAVILKSRNRFSDARLLLDYGFQNFRNIHIIDENKLVNYLDIDRELAFYTGKSLTVTVRKDQEISLKNSLEIDQDKLVKGAGKNELIGRIYFYNNDEVIGTVPLFTAEEVLNQEKTLFWTKIWQLIKEKVNKPRIY